MNFGISEHFTKALMSTKFEPAKIWMKSGNLKHGCKTILSRYQNIFTISIIWSRVMMKEKYAHFEEDQVGATKDCGALMEDY